MNIPELPIQVVAVTDAPATNYHHTQELNQVLVAEVITIITVIIIVDLSYHLILFEGGILTSFSPPSFSISTTFPLVDVHQTYTLSKSMSKKVKCLKGKTTFPWMSFHQGNNLADQLNAHFMTSETNQKKNNFYNNFFREVHKSHFSSLRTWQKKFLLLLVLKVCDKKAEIEKAFSMDDRLSGRLDDSGEGTLERPPR